MHQKTTKTLLAPPGLAKGRRIRLWLNKITYSFIPILKNTGRVFGLALLALEMLYTITLACFAKHLCNPFAPAVNYQEWL